MKLNYFPDTDSLYIDLSHRPSVESQEAVIVILGSALPRIKLCQSSQQPAPYLPLW